jgi:hypothetical protein
MESSWTSVALRSILGKDIPCRGAPPTPTAVCTLTGSKFDFSKGASSMSKFRARWPTVSKPVVEGVATQELERAWDVDGVYEDRGVEQEPVQKRSASSFFGGFIHCCF